MSVNLKKFKECFDRSLKNPDFYMNDPNNCIAGSAPEFAYIEDYWRVKADDFGVNNACFNNWFMIKHPMWNQVNFYDAEECIEVTKVIVEEHHGPQEWL